MNRQKLESIGFETSCLELGANLAPVMSHSMELSTYDGKIWASKEQKVHPALLRLLSSKDQLIVLGCGKPAYDVVIGVPHHAPAGVKTICENRRPADENAASYALVAYSALQERGVACKLVIAAHPLGSDPNKDRGSAYCEAVFKEATGLLLECHGMAVTRDRDLELSAGSNTYADTRHFGELLFSALQQRYALAVQQRPGSREAVIYKPQGDPAKGSLEMPATKTASLKMADEKKIPALHLEAKPRFRKHRGGKSGITDDGAILGRALAAAIVDWRNKRGEIHG